MVGEAFLQLLRNPIWGGGIIKAPKIINVKNNKTMTKKFIAILATLPMATLGMAGLAMADGDVIVTNLNKAEVSNVVVAGANSGWNTANGGNGGSAGNGGSVWGSDNDDNVTGNGGAAGNGGNGGSVTTGIAVTDVDILNVVNHNTTDVDLCACEEDENDAEEEDASDDVVVTNLNGAGLLNIVGAGADSGWNMTDGGAAGNGGKGGKVAGEDNDDNTTGNGGAAGNGGNGGTVKTGDAGSFNVLTNLINTNITRVRR